MKCVLCKERTAKGTDISFHLFPRDKMKRKLWLSACNLEESDITFRSTLCSKHFTPDDMVLESFYRQKRLKYNAIPRVVKRFFHEETDENEERFDHSYAINQRKLLDISLCSKCGSSLSTKVATKATQTVETLTNTRTELEEPVWLVGADGSLVIKNINPPQPRYIGDFKAEHFSNPLKAERSLILMKDLFHRQQQKIRTLQQQQRRDRFERFNSLQGQLRVLKTENMISDEAYNKIMIQIKKCCKIQT